MNEAKKLPPLPDDAMTTHEPSVLPLDDGEQNSARVAKPVSAHAVTTQRATYIGRKATNTALILFLVGLVAFAAGAAIAFAMLVGALDLHSGWLKDALNVVKGFLHHHAAK